MKKQFVATLVVVLFASIAVAQTVTVTAQDGTKTDINYTSSTFKKRYVQLNTGGRLEYAKITEIATADFDAYERAVKRTSRRENQHVTVKYTGEGDVHALRLQKLEKKRQGAGAARGAGGLLMLLGVLSGERDVYAAGMVTYGAGTIAKDINTDKTIEAQNDAIFSLQAQQAKEKQLKKADSLEAQYRIEYGDENVDGLIALVDGNHERALAFTGVAETSDDAHYRWSAVWLKAIIYADQDNREALEKEYDRLIVLDPDISSYEDADHWIELLLKELEKMRQG